MGHAGVLEKFLSSEARRRVCGAFDPRLAMLSVAAALSLAPHTSRADPGAAQAQRVADFLAAETSASAEVRAALERLNVGVRGVFKDPRTGEAHVVFDRRVPTSDGGTSDRLIHGMRGRDGVRLMVVRPDRVSISPLESALPHPQALGFAR